MCIVSCRLKCYQLQEKYICDDVFFNVTTAFYQSHLQEIEQELSQSSKLPVSQMDVSVLVPGPNLLTVK